jgi:hypothetical protein
MLLHGRSKNSIPQEVIVPMIVFTHNNVLRQQFSTMVPVNHNKCTHFQIFPTVLHLMGYDKKQVVEKYYKTLLDAITENCRLF